MQAAHHAVGTTPGMSYVPQFAIGDGATAAVEATAETLCYLNRHRHLATRPACVASRRQADATLAALSFNRRRASAVGNWLLDRVVKSIAADIERAELA